MKEEKSMKLLPFGFNPTEILNANSLIIVRDDLYYLAYHLLNVL